ncbi:tautomerase family protein [Kitasatospora sp. NBC_01287]|uniref:tautomerase family protein n=1 Tax=Kitasatospora sp. NBC_01287 TaxID=2903573 RepID=UPI00224E8ABF|nr:tautomerase family protein [Kitasatospora sp. NBC_01287]MCX4744086.1 tautomerase family protein [Kitasatospora sp. NBC_01287]
MPIVRITLSADRPAETRRPIADAVHRALVEVVGIPAGDRFQTIEVLPRDAMIFDPEYLDVARQDVVAIQITLRGGRTPEVKRRLYAHIAEGAAAVGVRPEDVFVVLTENGSADWSVGNGKAQLLDLELPANQS